MPFVTGASVSADFAFLRLLLYISIIYKMKTTAECTMTKMES